MQGIPLGEFLATRVPAINPAQHADEEFELFSVPAFDIGAPERLAGRQIGSAKKLVQPDDVLLSRIVPHIRRAWVVPPKNGARQIASGEWIIFRDRYLHSAYARFYLTSDQFHAQFMRTVAGVGGSLLRARSDAVGRIEIPLPPLDEQRRIAAILDKADAIRRRRRQALAEIDNLLRATFLDMFGDPVRNTKQLPRAQLADFEENLTSGSRGWAKHYAAQGNVFIRIGNVGRDRLLLEDLVYVKAPENAEAQRTRVRPGDLLISITADLGRTAVIPSGFPTAYINQHLASIRLRGLSPTYTSAFLSSRGGQRQFDRLDRTGVKSGLNFDDIRSLEILIPDPKEQASYEAFVQRLHEYSGQAASEAAQAERLFQSLSNRAFRGEL